MRPKLKSREFLHPLCIVKILSVVFVSLVAIFDKMRILPTAVYFFFFYLFFINATCTNDKLNALTALTLRVASLEKYKLIID